jgi:hypothetical protein
MPREADLPSAPRSRQFPGMQSHQQDTEIVQRMRPEEKLSVMNALIRQAWELKVAAIRARETS